MKQLWAMLYVAIIANLAHGSPIQQNFAIGMETASPLEEVGGNFEGDMVISAEQENALSLGYTSLIGEYHKWPNSIVPYTIDTTVFTTVQQSNIVAALQQIELVSCIRFAPRTTEVDYVLVTGEYTGCHASLGRRGGKQTVNLQPNGCMSRGTIIHEFLHSLGFVHMQSASDRDFYVKINWDAIPIEKSSNFRNYTSIEIDDFGIPYDYDSVMHYGPTAYGIGNRQTIVPLKPDAKIGQRNGLSYKDIMRLNFLYPNCY